MYDPTLQSTALGKRPLHYDVQDMPSPKRHETFANNGILTSVLSSAPAAQIWPPQSTMTSFTTGVGLSEEAADMCATWFQKYAMLPNDKHIESLSQLTGESAEAIRSWFGRILKQGMGPGIANSDSAYKSQTAIPQLDQFWDDFSDVVQVPHVVSKQDTQEATLTQAASATPERMTEITTVTLPALQGRKNQRCTPTDDLSLLSRDANKIYQCTRKCGKRYGRKCDWKRNEEEGYPCKSWVCSLCRSQGTETVKPCFRKYHFAQVSTFDRLRDPASANLLLALAFPEHSPRKRLRRVPGSKHNFVGDRVPSQLWILQAPIRDEAGPYRPHCR
jgi:hypothetical protein